MIRICIFVFVVLSLFACEDVKDNSQPWKISSSDGMFKTIINADEAVDVKICADKYKNIGFATNVNVHYDGKTYYRLIEGLCITLHAKQVRLRFATPSSGKRAEGTFEILESGNK